MDFDNLDLTGGAESTWVHLEIDGSPLFWDGKAVTATQTDKPCRVSVKPASANEVYRAFKRYQDAEQAFQVRTARAKDRDIDGLAAKHNERSEDLMDEVIVAAVDGFENIYIGGQEAKPSADAVRQMIDRNASYSKRAIRGQLFAAISEKREGFTNADGG